MAITLEVTFFALIGVVILFIISMLLIKHLKGLVEEDILRIPVFVSPVTKIVKLIFFNIIRSAEAILIIIALLLISFSTAYSSTYLYSSTEMNVSHIPKVYNVLLISNRYVNNTEEINEDISLISQGFVKIVQLFNGLVIEQENKSYYLLPLLIKCYINKSTVIDIDYMCKLIRHGNVAIIDEKSEVDFNTITIKNQRFELRKVNLSNIANVEILPGIYLFHSLGIIGGSPILVSSTNVIIFPDNRNLFENLCEGGCDVKTILLIRDSNTSRYMEHINELLKYFEIVAIRHNNKVIVYSPNLIPSSKTIIGIGISLFFSLIFSISVSGGLAEKINQISQKLTLSGITHNMLSSSLAMVMIITFLIFFTPILALVLLNRVSAISLVTYLLSAILSTMVIMVRASMGLKTKGAKISVKSSISISVPTELNVNEFRIELERSFSADDFFLLTELETIEATPSNIEIRVELMYKKSLSSIITVEIYGEKSNGIWSYNILVDVWSLEEMSVHENVKLASMALSKVQGIVIKCITKSQ